MGDHGLEVAIEVPLMRALTLAPCHLLLSVVRGPQPLCSFLSPASCRRTNVVYPPSGEPVISDICHRLANVAFSSIHAVSHASRAGNRWPVGRGTVLVLDVRMISVLLPVI